MCLHSTTSLLQVLQGHFSQLKQRLLACEPADFGLEKDCDWNVGIPQGALHQSQAALLLGCLEVLIEDVVVDATGMAATPLWQCTVDTGSKVPTWLLLRWYGSSVFMHILQNVDLTVAVMVWQQDPFAQAPPTNAAVQLADLC